MLQLLWLIPAIPFASAIQIKGGNDFKSFLFEPAIRQQRETEIADANEDDRLQTGCAQFVGNHLGQFRDVISEPARAEMAEIGEVLAQLRRLHAGNLRERLARHGLNIVILQTRKAAQINR